MDVPIPIEPLTKTSRIKTTGAHIGICTHITMEELHQRLSEVEVFNGFANRFNWCFAKRSKIVPFPIPMPEERLFIVKEKLAESLSIAREIHQMRFSEESKALWMEVYTDLSRDRWGLVGTVLNRAEAQVIRLAMVYALLDGSSVIEAWHLEAACAFWEYSSRSAEHIFRDRDSDATRGKIITALKGGPRSKTDLYRAFQNRISSGKIENALIALINEGQVARGKEKGRFKPKEIYSLI